MILPLSPTATIPNIELQPSYTYRVESATKRIAGYTDGLNAMIQAYSKIIQTERYAYPIYNTDYGIELTGLIGQDMDLVLAVLPSRIEDALKADDRTIEIRDLECKAIDNETVDVTCTVLTSEGEVPVHEEVSLSGPR